eukprot:2180468-Ditylum_brightwellii.AAC.1
MASEAEPQSFTDNASKILTPENEEELLTQEQTHEPVVQTGEADEESSNKSSNDNDEANNSSDKDNDSMRKESKCTKTSTMQKTVISSAMVTWKWCLLQQCRTGCPPGDIDPGENELHQE